MNKNYYLELLLFLTEVKAKKKITEKDQWELDKHIDFLKEIIDNKEEQNNNLKKRNETRHSISSLIKWIAKFLMSP
jgi:hypothetical protein